MLDETYCLHIITDFLKSKKIHFVYSNAKVGLSIYNHGCKIQFCNNKYYMSIQTHPSISGNSFAETAILDNTGAFIFDKYNYNGDVIRHNTPEELFTHIIECMNE